MKSGDLAQQIRRLDRVRTLAAEDGEREGTYPPMGSRELAGQARTIMAAQIRSAKAQAESGNPAMVAGRRTLCTRAMVRTLISQTTVTGGGISAGSNRAPWLARTLRTSAASRHPARA